MNTPLLKRQLARLNRHTFAAFVSELFSANHKSKGDEEFLALPEAGEDVYVQPLLDSYGSSIHRVYVLHFPPMELFRPSRELQMNDPTLVRQLVRVRNLYKERIGYWGMVSPCLRPGDALNVLGVLTNLCGLEEPVYQELLIPAYRRVARYCGLRRPPTPVIVGSCDSFVDLSPEETREAFDRLLIDHRDGLAVTLGESGAAVGEFVNDRSLAAGASVESAYPYEPVFISLAVEQRAIITQFQNLLNENATESKLEEFLRAHYKDIFGSQYDRIETQLWLRFPELDITGHDRRLDVFLRNSVVNDWELLEVKRPVNVTREYRDIPVFTREVTNAIQQIKNYKRALDQDKLKRHFAAEGITYYEPTLSVVIGRTPQIPHEQWRWLKSSEASVKLLTFDDLLGELRCRLEDRYELFQAALARVR